MIAGIKPINSASNIKKAVKKTPKFSISSPFNKKPAKQESFFNPSENLYCLHEFEDHKAGHYNDAKNILDLLRKYRKTIVCGQSSKNELKDIQNALAILKLSHKSKDYAEVIKEVETLALVELAKKKIFLENVS
jgi:hypothetical protein